MDQKNFTNFYFDRRGNRQQSYGNGTKKAVKHFTDLDVYQKALEASVFVAKNFRPAPEVSSSSGNKGQPGTKGATSDGTDLQSAGNIGSGMTNNFILKNMVALALAIPHLIAQAHSSRFGSSEQCLLTLDKVMLDCNRMVVYLEQTRDICETGVELDQFEQQIKNYFFIRQKVLNLQRVWKKYIEINKEQQKQ